MDNSGRIFHAIISEPKNPDRESSKYKVAVKGPVVSGKKDPALSRRGALVKLLEVTEKSIAREVTE